MEQKNIQLLVIGPPRSGTTLLAAMISSHTDAAIMFESRYMLCDRILSKKVVGNKLCIPNQIELTNKNTLRKNIILNKLIKIPFLENQIYKYVYPLAYFSIADHLQIDNSRIIAIVRNGNAVISSIMKRGVRVFEDALYRWARAIEVIYTLKIQHSDRIILVSFENLVQYPDKNMKKACAFLGIDYQQQMLDGYKFTPLYTEQKGIDKQKAFRAEKENIDFKLESYSPDILKKYDYLQEHSCSF